MKQLDTSTINNVKSLRSEGFSYRDIAKETTISVSSAYKYASTLRISKELQNRIRLKYISKPRKVDIPSSLSLELVRIIGHCLFDGCVSSGSISYANASKELMNEFCSDMKSVFGVDFAKIKSYKKKTEYFQVHYSYKLIVDYLLEFTPSYSTKNINTEIPEIILEAKKEYICEFLRTFWDDEGSVKACGDVTAKTKSKKVSEQLIKLHERIGVNVKSFYDTKNKAYEIYVCRNNGNFEAFKRNIGFKYGIVCRGKYSGLKKADALLKI